MIRCIIPATAMMLAGVGCSPPNIEKMPDKEIAVLLSENAIPVSKVTSLPEKRLLIIAKHLLSIALDKAEHLSKYGDKISRFDFLRYVPLRETVVALQLLEPLMRGTKFDKAFSIFDRYMMRYPNKGAGKSYVGYGVVRNWVEEHPWFCHKAARRLGLNDASLVLFVLCKRWRVFEPYEERER